MIIYSIYKITNLTNNKIYIGWTYRKPDIRFDEHIKGKKSPISQAIQKYGVDNFTFEVLYQTYDHKHSQQMETQFIVEHNSLVDQRGYNRDLGGTGHKRTAATIEKHRKKIKGRKQSPEHVAKRIKSGVDNPSYGRKGEDAFAYGKAQSDYQKQRTAETNSKTYIVTFPDGHEETITNLKQFCANYNLDSIFMGKIARCIKYHHQYKGYKVRFA